METSLYSLLEQIKKGISEKKLPCNALEDDVIKEIVDAIYGHMDIQKVDVIKNAYIKAKKYICNNNDFEAMVHYIDIFMANIIAVQTIEEDWIKKSNQLINAMQVAKKPIKKIIKMSIGEIFSQQNRDTSGFAYNRLDTVVRYLAAEEYHGKNDYGFYLYGKMQGARMGQDYVEYSIEKYKALIASYDENGYDENSCITCDQNLHLIDGSHRLALGLYYGIPNISIEILPQATDIFYGIEWFRQNGFTEEEIQIICDKCIDLMEEYIVPFTCILWPPVQKYFDEITQTLASEYEIVGYNDYEYSEETFERLVRGIYHIDDIEEWKIEKKIAYMKNHQPKKVRLIKLFLVGPDFRLKKLNNAPISKVGEYIKSVIRSNYESKVENYFYDIIIHTGDNFKQNKYIAKLFEQSFSLREYFREIEDNKYIIIKYETPYQTKDFPNTYAFSKDLDIVVVPEEYKQLVEKTISFLTQKVSGYQIRSLETEYNYRIRIELEGYLIYQIDISCAVEGLSQEFLVESIRERVWSDSFYCAKKSFEIIYRLNELIKAPHKIHHAIYVKNHFENVDFGLIKNVFPKMDVTELLEAIENMEAQMYVK